MTQPRSQGLSSYRPLGRKDERPWERGWKWLWPYDGKGKEWSDELMQAWLGLFDIWQKSPYFPDFV